MKLLGNLCIFLLFSLSVFSQNNYSISGILLDKADEQPLPAGTVELLNPKDSTAVKAVVSNKEGKFSLADISRGNYILRVNYIGYTPFLQDINVTRNQSLGNLYLSIDNILLDELVVEGKRPEMIVKNDTLEYDAQSFKTEENAVVEDLLKKLPGIEVDTDGKITAGGKEVKKFLVQNKEFFSDDPKIASKNLPADMVEKVQVIDRKSEMARMTGFDDGEEETVINLTVRPGMMQGTMGNALLGGGANATSDHDGRYQGGAFINHMQETDRYTLMLNGNNNNNMGASDLGANQFGGMRMRMGGGGGITEAKNAMFNLSKEFSSALMLDGGIRYNNMDRHSINKTEQATLSEKVSQLDKTAGENNYLSNSFSANFRLEWKPDTLNTLIFRPNFSYNKSHSDEIESSNRYDYNTLDPIYESNSVSYSKGRGFSFGGSLNYAHKFSSKLGRVFSLSANGNFNDNISREVTTTETKKYIETPQIPSNLSQQSQTDNNTNNFGGTISFVEPIGRNNFLQLSYRLSYNDTKSINNTFDLEDKEGNIPPAEYLPDYAILNDSLSRSTVRNSLEQRIGLSFKAVRAKYNYTIGLNLDPSSSVNETWQPRTGGSVVYPYVYDSYLAYLRGDTLISSIEQNVVNFSPMLDFRYNFGQRTNLRLSYEGRTNQPSANQLRDYIDQSRPTNITQGNPNLKPGYSNNIRAEFQKYIPETQFMYNFRLNGGFSVNDITQVTELLEGGVRLTTYENVNGNWNANLNAGFNTPLRNKKFTISNFGNASFRKTNSFVNTEKNIGKNFSIRDFLRFNYRSELFDIGVNASITYNHVTYSARPDNNRNTYDYGFGGETTWYLPYKWTISSDINWTDRTGYGEGYNISEVMWNASVTKQLFNKKFGTGSLKLQIYDILQDRSNISFNTTTNGYRTSETNSIPSYFMCSFIYKFTYFPKSSFASEEDMMPRRMGRGGGRGPGGPPPGIF